MSTNIDTHTDTNTNANIPKQMFILSGQSNMSGRGGVITTNHHHHLSQHWDGVVPPECTPHPTILRLTAALKWVPAHPPLHVDIDSKKVCGLGPGMAFANRLRDRVDIEQGGMTIGLVPCAVGGTKIKEWARGEVLYEGMIKRAKAGLEGGVGGEIKGLLWFQGESDCDKECDAVVYKELMEKFVSDVREDLTLPELPIIQVALASGDKKYIERVREAQLGIKLPNVVCVDAKGLKLNHDNLHLSTEAQVKLGHMLADAYLSNFCSSSATK